MTNTPFTDLVAAVHVVQPDDLFANTEALANVYEAAVAMFAALRPLTPEGLDEMLVTMVELRRWNDARKASPHPLPSGPTPANLMLVCKNDRWSYIPAVDADMKKWNDDGWFACGHKATV